MLRATSAQNVAMLRLKKSSLLPDRNVDASIAQVHPGMVRISGCHPEIGPISRQTVVASINQPVKKSGRTTGLTRSTICGLECDQFPLLTTMNALAGRHSPRFSRVK